MRKVNMLLRNNVKYIKPLLVLSPTIVLILLAALFLTGCSMRMAPKTTLPVYNTPDFTPEWDAKDNIHTIPAFSFTDQNGNAFGSKELESKIYVVDFFFTTCPGICPRLTANLSKVQEAFKNDANISIVSFSVTPDFDKSSVLNTYAQSHNINYDKWRLLTGDKKEIYNLARKSFFADEDLGEQQNENDFLHTENVLLIDSQKRIRGIYKGTIPLEIEKLVKEINILKSE